MPTDDTIQKRVGTLKDLISHLNKIILDKDAKDFLLRPATSSLHDVECYLLPQALNAKTPEYGDSWFRAVEFQLQSAENQLQHVQEMVSKYGANLRVVG